MLSNRWGHAGSAPFRGVATMRLWHGTLLAVGGARRTSGVAFPFVLERLSNTPARLQEPSPHTVTGQSTRKDDILLTPSGLSSPGLLLLSPGTLMEIGQEISVTAANYGDRLTQIEQGR